MLTADFVVEFPWQQAENNVMVLNGRIENGKVVLPGDVSLPDGTEVTLIIPEDVNARASDSKKSARVRLPLVASDKPGSRNLTARDLAEILDEDDISP
jgi:hypothetical protein